MKYTRADQYNGAFELMWANILPTTGRFYQALFPGARILAIAEYGNGSEV